MPTSVDVRISSKYVFRSMLIGLLAGGVVPAGLIAFMAYQGFDPYLTIGAFVATLALTATLLLSYRRGVKQTIQLHPDRIVFDYLTYNQEYRFFSPNEWELTAVGRNWRLTALRDGSSKLVPISAFPALLREVQAYYQLRSTAGATPSPT